MDLLCAAYAAVSDEEEDDEHRKQSEKGKNGSEKRRKLWNERTTDSRSHSSDQQICDELTTPTPTTMPFSGRYISKRERAAQTSHLPSTVNPSPVVESISDSVLPSRILALLRRGGEGSTQHNRIPKGLSVSLTGHTKAVNCVRWSPTHGHLLASGAMDHVAYIWNVWNGVGHQKARLLNYHNAAIKDLQWSKEGLHLLTCGYDQTSRLTDVEIGGSNGALRLWDIRTSKVISEYLRGLGPIMDIDFSNDGKHFVSSSDNSKTNSSEKSIVVWDFRTQFPLSNQVYVEAYTCPCVRYHPVEASFVAQSNGNYIAIFSSNPPFKLNKYKRFEKHEVSGFPIRCNFSQDGELLVSGSADGYLYFYSYRSSKVLKRMQAYGHACTDVVYHPLIPSVLAACSWNGAVSVFE
eukprot:Gb_11736 [translate_table: standard]